MERKSEPPNSVDGIRKMNIRYSVVVPVYNEEESLRDLFAELLREFAGESAGYEIIFVDDCSSDKSPVLMKEFQGQFPEVVRILSFTSRQGQTSALKQGFAAAQGDIVVSLDADLQNDPADISRLVAKMDEGYDCVCGWRKSRQDTFVKAFFSKLGNLIQRTFTGLTIHDTSCTLRIYKRECALQVNLDQEGFHRFIPLDLFFKGYRIGEVVSHHRERKFGHSKYSHKRLFRVVKDFMQIVKNKGKK